MPELSSGLSRCTKRLSCWRLELVCRALDEARHWKKPNKPYLDHNGLATQGTSTVLHNSRFYRNNRLLRSFLKLCRTYQALCSCPETRQHFVLPIWSKNKVFIAKHCSRTIFSLLTLTSFGHWVNDILTAPFGYYRCFLTVVLIQRLLLGLVFWGIGRCNICLFALFMM